LLSLSAGTRPPGAISGNKVVDFLYLRSLSAQIRPRGVLMRDQQWVPPSGFRRKTSPRRTGRSEPFALRLVDSRPAQIHSSPLCTVPGVRCDMRRLRRQSQLSLQCTAPRIPREGARWQRRAVGISFVFPGFAFSPSLATWKMVRLRYIPAKMFGKDHNMLDAKTDGPAATESVHWIERTRRVNSDLIRPGSDRDVAFHLRRVGRSVSTR
jgi:hypothetical protein